MIRLTLLVAATLFATPLVAAQEQEQAYIYVRYNDANGASVRHKLDCLDSECKLSIKSEVRSMSLSAVEKKELLDALQAELDQFHIATDTASSDNLMKVKFKYDSPGKRVEIERRLPADKPADLTPEMLRVIETHLELDLSRPVLSR